MDSLQHVVPRALALLFRSGPMSQGKLDVAWRVAVGDAVSRAGSVHLLAGGLVEVRAVDQRWQKELKRSAPVILARLTSLLGDAAITRLVIK